MSYFVGRRSGRGIFVYPDGSVYEGFWRKNQRHGKGRYNYANGDTYCGSWYYGQRHGIGIYTKGIAQQSRTCGTIRFRGTWRHGIRVGPFEMEFGIEEKSICLHGSWDNYFPQGPVVFNFDNQYLQMGYFETPGRLERLLEYRKKHAQTEEINAEEEMEESEKEPPFEDLFADEPSLWRAQDLCPYDFALLPQEPVPLPLSDSDVSVCSLITPPLTAAEGDVYYPGEAEEGEMECEQCMPEQPCSTSEVELSSEVCSPKGDPCAIEIKDQPKCAL